METSHKKETLHKRTFSFSTIVLLVVFYMVLSGKAGAIISSLY